MPKAGRAFNMKRPGRARKPEDPDEERAMKRAVYGDPASANVLIQIVDDHDLAGIENEVNSIREKAGEDFCLLALKTGDWNRDLSPWKAPAVFGREDFGDGAGETLSAVLTEMNDPGKKYWIGGYSLAGLFALWAACQTDRFEGVAAASPSVWFPGFVEYMREHPVRAGRVYLSLGDREEKARNPVLSSVGGCIRDCYRLLQEQGLQCTLEWNQGNHFMDADIRTAAGFAWLLNARSTGNE